MKRLTDIAIALFFLVVGLPLFVFATLGILVSAPGPVLYPAQRQGRGNRPFTMYKFRTMHYRPVNHDKGDVITSNNDSRIFKFGNLLRKLKIDEFPQFFNVLLGDMSIVGPRPEDPKIVSEHYTAWMMKTLDVSPGITSPGAIFYYADGEQLITTDDPEGSYVKALLSQKLAIERAYIARASWLSDIVCIGHTAIAIFGKAAGIRIRPMSRDLVNAKKWCAGI